MPVVAVAVVFLWLNSWTENHSHERAFLASHPCTHFCLTYLPPRPPYLHFASDSFFVSSPAPRTGRPGLHSRPQSSVLPGSPILCLGVSQLALPMAQTFSSPPPLPQPPPKAGLVTYISSKGVEEGGRGEVKQLGVQLLFPEQPASLERGRGGGHAGIRAPRLADLGFLTRDYAVQIWCPRVLFRDLQLNIRVRGLGVWYGGLE